ncbi:MAG: sigma-70 family RNA polymerase sigma factor [Hydrogeniiclostridium mannosilyticum]
MLGDRLQLPDRVPGGSDEARHRAVLRVLRRAMEGELTQRQRQCLELYYFQGLTQEETGRRLGVTAATVSRHIKRARERCSRCWCTAFRISPGPEAGRGAGRSVSFFGFPRIFRRLLKTWPRTEEKPGPS